MEVATAFRAPAPIIAPELPARPVPVESERLIAAGREIHDVATDLLTRMHRAPETFDADALRGVQQSLLGVQQILVGLDERHVRHHGSRARGEVGRHRRR